MTKKRLVLNEEPDEITSLLDEPEEILPVEMPLDLEIPVEDNNDVPPMDVVVNSYSDMLQNLLKKQWDVINEADSLVATLNAEESSAVNKEDLIAILNKLTEDTTVAIGMVTKALGVIDPSQEALMNQGVAKAEEVIGASEEDIPDPEGVTFDLSDGSGEPVEVTVKDGEIIDTPEEEVEELREEGVKEDWDTVHSISFSDDEYYDRYWKEEALWQIESMLDVSDEELAEDEDLMILNSLDEEALKELCADAAEAVRNNDYVWETAFDCMRDAIYENLQQYVDRIQSVEVDLNKKEDEEGE